MRVPQAEQTVSPVTVSAPKQGFASPVASAFGTDVAQAIESMGETGQKIANVWQRHIDKRRKQQNQANSAAVDTKARLDIQNRAFDESIEKVTINGQQVERPVGFLNRKLTEADGATVEFDQWYLKNRKDYLKGVTDPGSIGGVVCKARRTLHER